MSRKKIRGSMFNIDIVKKSFKEKSKIFLGMYYSIRKVSELICFAKT